MDKAKNEFFVFAPLRNSIFKESFFIFNATFRPDFNCIVPIRFLSAA